MVPITAPIRSYQPPQESPPQLATLQQLKAKLGDQASLLDYIPINEVTIEDKPLKGSWMSQRIQVAIITYHNGQRKVWVHMSNTVQ